MDSNYYIKQLAENGLRIKSFLQDTGRKEQLWKPSEDKWCLLEVICHLYDEEELDFRNRLNHVLTTPDEDLPSSIDPERWVKDKKYIEQDFDEKLTGFLNKREQSVTWLHSLENPNWKNAYQHPKYGPLTAKMFLVNWVAHDYLHIRQIVKLKYDYLKELSHQNLQYAGEW